LPRQPETVGQGEPALELGSSPFRPEPYLEPARDERDLGGGLVADEPLEVGEESLAELRRLQAGEVQSHPGLEGAVERAPHEVECRPRRQPVEDRRSRELGRTVECGASTLEPSRPAVRRGERAGVAGVVGRESCYCAESLTLTRCRLERPGQARERTATSRAP